MLVVIINGVARSGKDTFCKMCCEYVHTKSISKIDTVTSIMKKYFGIDLYKDKTEKNRKIYADFDYAIDEILPDFWSKRVVEEVNMAAKENVDILFVHCRLPERIDAAKNSILKNTKYECVTLLINNDNVKKLKSNIADASVFDYGYDFIIENNDGIDELKDRAKYFCSIHSNK
ncbi:hypothetical protein [Anaerostipes faecalis]|uniref:hypothetical protein n=1 Tax=Anaerostipes faecalis TaxID=2738446 RepID=UPI003EFC3B4A